MLWTVGSQEVIDRSAEVFERLLPGGLIQCRLTAVLVAVVGGPSRPKGVGGGLLSEWPAHPWKLTFAEAIEQIRAGDCGRSRAPTDGSDEFVAERLHPNVTYWCCRPIRDLPIR